MSDKKEWGEWSVYVLKELERLNSVVEQLTKNLNEVNLQIAILQVKAGAWGGLAAIVTIGIALLINFIMGK